MDRTKKNRILDILFYGLVIISPFISVLSSNFRGYSASMIRDGITLLLILYIFMLIMKKDRISLNRSNILLLVFIIYGFLHVFITILDTMTSLFKFRIVFLYPILSVLAIIYYKNREKKVESVLYKFKNIFIIQGIIMIAFSILEMIYREKILVFLYKDDFMNIHRNLLGQTGIRLVSLMYNPINLALFLNIFLVFIIYSTNEHKETTKISSILKIFTIILTLIIIMLTFSRVSYVITIVTFIIYALFNKKKLLYFLSLRSLFVTMLLITIISMFNQSTLDTYVQNLNKRFERTTINAFEENVRLENWAEYTDSIFSQGKILYLWGSGLGSSNSNSQYQSEVVKRVENSYVSFLGEVGIIGFLLFLMIIVNIIKNTYIRGKKKPKEAKMLFQILVIFLIGSLTNDMFHNNPFSFYFWCLYCYLEVSDRNNERINYHI